MSKTYGFLRGAFCAAAIATSPASAHDFSAGEEPLFGAEQIVNWNNHVYYIQIDAAASEGAFGAVVAQFPYSEAPPLHIHHDAIEIFHVLSGTIELQVDGARTALAAGQTSFAPKGSEHGFVVTSEDGATVLVTFTPGGFEGFFAAVEGLEIPADMAQINKIASEFNLSIVGPPIQMN